MKSILIKAIFLGIYFLLIFDIVLDIKLFDICRVLLFVKCLNIFLISHHSKLFIIVPLLISVYLDNKILLVSRKKYHRPSSMINKVILLLFVLHPETNLPEFSNSFSIVCNIFFWNSLPFCQNVVHLFT